MPTSLKYNIWISGSWSTSWLIPHLFIHWNKWFVKFENCWHQKLICLISYKVIFEKWFKEKWYNRCGPGVHLVFWKLICHKRSSKETLLQTESIQGSRSLSSENAWNSKWIPATAQQSKGKGILGDLLWHHSFPASKIENSNLEYSKYQTISMFF